MSGRCVSNNTVLITHYRKRPEHLGRDGWESVLKTSTKWGLLDIRNMAIRALLHCSVDAIDRISLGRIYGIPYWMRTGYLHLSRREDAISEEEGMRLGAKSLSRLCWIREKSHTCLSTSDDCRSGPPYRYEQRVLVNTLFADEFEEAETAWACTESMLPSPALSSELSSEWLDTAVSQPIPNEVFYIAHVIFQVRSTFNYPGEISSALSYRLTNTCSRYRAYHSNVQNHSVLCLCYLRPSAQISPWKGRTTNIPSDYTESTPTVLDLF